MTGIEGTDSTEAPLVVCTVGTDHHPFDRLVGWCDALAQAEPGLRVEVQYGATRAPQIASGDAFWSKEELTERLAAAHVVITHGGPGSISEARRGGTRPIVVPRDPALGEHVDGHQQRFVARLVASGVVTTVTSETQLVQEVRRLIGQPRGTGEDAAGDLAQARESARRFGELVDRLLSGSRRSG